MKRKLYVQIKNDWRENIWLIVELAVVFLVIWAIVSLTYVQTKGLWTPKGFDASDVYMITVNQVDSLSPNYDRSDKRDIYRDVSQIVRSLSANRNVEAVAIGSNNPYTYNFYGLVVTRADVADSVLYYGNRRTVTPEYVDVFRLKSLTGATSRQLKEMLERGDILISNSSDYERAGRNPFDLKGKMVYLSRDSTKTYRVGDVIENIRRNDYEEISSGTLLMAMPEGQVSGPILVRVKPGCGALFKEDYAAEPAMHKCGNAYLSDLRSMDSLRNSAQRSYDIFIRSMVIIMSFMLITIFLGLLGTFWFRMQQRVGEIAIRKVCGARRRDIFARVISEGLVLLLLAIIIVSAAIWPFMDDVENELGENRIVFLVTEAAAALIVAAGIVVSLWFPARKAMEIEPAIAIKNE